MINPLANRVDVPLGRRVKDSADTFVRQAARPLLWLVVVLFATQLETQGARAPAMLRTETRQAFERYVELTEKRNDQELKRGNELLWVDNLPQDRRDEAYAALKRGDVQVFKLETHNNGELIRCPGGRIHHWVGAAFIPGAKLEDVLTLLKDYDHHSIFYMPEVERSKIESRNGDHFRVFLRFKRHQIITVTLNTEHEVQYFRDGPDSAHSRSSAVRIAEVENSGKSDEREKPPGDDDGFLWRMETWWRIQERGGGVYIQSEVASLTRDIPPGLGWMIGPFVTSIPRESLTFTLEATRNAVKTRAKNSTEVRAY